MNDKVYANYLMHGRTKGSRNGISTTKGYTAIGQKAKGHLVNGKYVYDAGVNLPTNYNGLDNYMKVSNSNKTQPYLHSLYPKGYANASDAMKNDPRYSSDSVYVVKYKGSDLNPKPVTKNDPDAKALRDYIGRLYVTNKQSVATNVAKAGKDKIALNKYDDKPQYLGHKELSDINNNLMLKKIKDEVASKLKAEKEEAVKAKTVVGSKNDWQQQAALEQWKQQNRNNIAAKKKADAAKQPTNVGAFQQAELERWKQQNRNNIAAKKEAALKEELRRSAALNKANIARANTEVRNKVVSGESNKGYTPYAEPGRVSNGIANEKTRNLIRLENLQNRVYAEQNKKAQEATEKANATKANATQMGLRNKVKAGAANNWQQNANKTAGIIGNMSREDRSLMKSKEWTSTDKDGTKKTNNSFNVNNKYGYSNYTKNDNGWHDVHMGEYNTTGVKGVKKQQDWNTSYERNHRSDIGNAVADAKADAKKAFKEAKADAKQAYANLKNKFKKKKKK